MRILILFVDMVRNNLITPNTKIYKFLNDLKGTWYKNSFSSFPDTPRGIGAFLSGKPAFINGCDNRVKYPRFFLKENTLFDVFKERGYKIDIFAQQREIIPSNFLKNTKFYISNIKEVLEFMDLEENHLIFMDIPTFHLVLDDCGYTLKGFKKADEELVKDLEIVFEKLNKDLFDDIYIFSDHGFKFMYEIIYQKIFKKKYLLFNEDRTNILFFHYLKNDKKLEIKENLIAIEDLYDYILNSKLKNRDYIVIEEYMNFKQQYSSIESWILVTNKEIYIRIYDYAVLIDRKLKKEKIGIIEEFDRLLIKESLRFRENCEIEEARKYAENENITLKNRQKYCDNKKIVDIGIDLLKNIKDFIK